MHTCYPELQLSTHAAGLIAYHLSCETLPELLQKPRVSAETQLRTSAARTLPRTALILSGISSQTGAFPTLSEVSLVFWTGVFLSPGRRIRVIGKETGPGPGGYG